MHEAQQLYTVDEDVASELTARTAPGRPGPVLVHIVRGFVDAGAAGQGAATHLTERFDAQRLVTFDADQLVDYRSRRPTMTFSSTHWSDYDEPTLAVDVLRDQEDVPFLLLHGVEPDVQWERFVGAVRDVVERFAVPLTVGVHGIPMGVPHTRPLGVTAHATRSELVEEHTSWFGTVQVPASVSALLELRLGAWGHDAMGFAVHVPHYLAQSSFPRAAQVALEHVERSTGLELDTARLEEAAREGVLEVDRQVEASDDVAAVVRALEEQYDSFARAIGRTSLLAEPSELPTADELGEQFERFLAQQGGDGPAL
jgi:predicted ATP-grasp superfamily ATP-dependent carboligase